MRLRARIAAALLCVCALVVGLPTTPAEANSAAPPPAGLEIIVTAENSQLVFANDIEVTWIIRNTGDHPVNRGRAQLSLARDTMAAPGDLLGDTPAGTRATPIAIVTTSELQPGESETFTSVIPATNLPFSLSSAAGVYGTQVRWSEQGSFTIHTVSPKFQSVPFIWRSFAAVGQLELATIIPVLFPHHSTPPITVELLDEQLLRDGVVEGLTQTAERFHLMLAVDPKITASVRGVGDAASVTAASLAERLSTGAIETFELQYADADPTVQLTSESGELLGPGRMSYLARFYRAPEFSQRYRPADPTIARAAWPAPGAVSADLIPVFRDAGFESIVLSGGNASGAPLGTIADTRLFVSNEPLEVIAAERVNAAGEAERSLADARLTALTLLLASQEAAQPEEPGAVQALLALSREVAATGENLDPLFAHLESLPWVSFISPTELEVGTIALHDPIDLTTQREIFDEALESEALIRDYARVLEQPRLLIDHERDRVLTLISAGRVADARAMREARGVFQAYDESLLSGVSIIDTEHTRLLGESSRIPVQLRNTLPFDAVVNGSVSAGSAALIVEDSAIEQTVIPARSTVTHLVPVTARVASGESSLQVRIFDTTSGDTIQGERFAISISTGIETVALGALVTIAVLLFGFGAVRSFVRHRS